MDTFDMHLGQYGNNPTAISNNIPGQQLLFKRGGGPEQRYGGVST